MISNVSSFDLDQNQADNLKDRIDFAKDIGSLGDFNKITNLDNVQSNNIETVTNNNSVEEQVYEESLSKGNDFQLRDTETRSSSVKVKDKNEKDTVLQKIEKGTLITGDNQKINPKLDHSVRLNVDNKIISFNLPKEVEKQLQASAEEKSQHSDRVKQKTEILISMEESKLQDSQKHLIEVESKKVDVQEHGGKHIDEEL